MYWGDNLSGFDSIGASGEVGGGGVQLGEGERKRGVGPGSSKLSGIH